MRVLLFGPVSWAHAAQGGVLPDEVTLGADLSIAGGGESVATWAEVVADGAERPRERWARSADLKR